jgi:hypothetical protein
LLPYDSTKQTAHKHVKIDFVVPEFGQYGHGVAKGHVDRVGWYEEKIANAPNICFVEIVTVAALFHKKRLAELTPAHVIHGD